LAARWRADSGGRQDASVDGLHKLSPGTGNSKKESFVKVVNLISRNPREEWSCQGKEGFRVPGEGALLGGGSSDSTAVTVAGRMRHRKRRRRNRHILFYVIRRAGI
jgi:hypothetical protein